jgi:hypothetical protein
LPAINSGGLFVCFNKPRNVEAVVSYSGGNRSLFVFARIFRTVGPQNMVFPFLWAMSVLLITSGRDLSLPIGPGRDEITGLARGPVVYLIRYDPQLPVDTLLSNHLKPGHDLRHRTGLRIDKRSLFQYHARLGI